MYFASQKQFCLPRAEAFCGAGKKFSIIRQVSVVWRSYDRQLVPGEASCWISLNPAAG
jgi:hypothetical protein